LAGPEDKQEEMDFEEDEVDDDERPDNSVQGLLDYGQYHNPSKGSNLKSPTEKGTIPDYD
jgi:hypothetical protein